MRYLLLLLLLPSVSMAQKKGYAHLYGGLSIKSGENKGIGGISVGGLAGQAVGIGAGVGFISYNGRPYIPLTADISFFGKPGKVSPVIIGRAGYGVYNASVPGGSVSGGFTGSGNIGIAVPAGRAKALLTVGASTYTLTTNKKLSTRDNRYMVCFGLLF